MPPGCLMMTARIYEQVQVYLTFHPRLNRCVGETAERSLGQTQMLSRAPSLQLNLLQATLMLER